MPTFEDRESLASVRAKINDAIISLENMSGTALGASQEAAQKAQAWAESATSPDGNPASKSSKTWANESANSASAALASQNSAAASSAAAGAASGRLVVATFAELATTFGYTTAGGRRQVAAGDKLWVLALGRGYEVMAEGATGWHLNYTGSGGVKLLVEMTGGSYDARAWGVRCDGVTDDAAAAQAAFDVLDRLGGDLIFPAGRMIFESQVTIDRTYASIGGGLFQGERNLRVSGYGCEIRTTGAISGLRIVGGFQPYKCTVEGFTIFHRGNVAATEGVVIVGSPLNTLRDVTVIVSNTLPATYAAFRVQNITASNPDTGSFWTVFDGCSVRPWSGADGHCAFGIDLVGAANATKIQNCMLSGANTHVRLGPHTGQTYTPNAVNIDGNWFEGPTTATAIELVGANAAGAYHVSGCRITNNRFEGLLNAVRFSGTGTTVQVMTYMAGNYADTSVANYIVNPSNIPLTSLDSNIVGSPMGPARFETKDGLIVKNYNAAVDVIKAVVQNIGSGISFERFDGTFLGSWRHRSFAGGIGTVLAGSASPYRPVGLANVQGISRGDTLANNFVGTATIAAGGTSVTVNFPNGAETDTNYWIFLTGNNAAASYAVTSRTTSGFTITASSAVASGAVVGWMLVRTA